MRKVFQKYRNSFRLDKCKLLENRVEFAGHDLTPDINCPAASRLNLITDWELPLSDQSLYSFVGLVIFYHRYDPYLELRIKTLRKLIKDYFHKPIPLMAWSPVLIIFFMTLKYASHHLQFSHGLNQISLLSSRMIGELRDGIYFDVNI